MRTRYERLLERLKDLREKRDSLAAQADQEKRDAARALADGRPIPVMKGLAQQVDLLDTAVEMAEVELAEAEAEHLKAQLAKLDGRRKQVDKERATAEEAWQKAQAAYRQAQAVYSGVYATSMEAYRVIERESDGILARLRQIEPEPPEEPVATRTVEAWLADFRAGAIRSFLRGADRNADEAYGRYEAELAEIADWARRARVSGRYGTGAPAEPECLKHYSRERIREIAERSERRGALSPGMGVRAGTGPGGGGLVRQSVPL